jgi:hypothetical protein
VLAEIDSAVKCALHLNAQLPEIKQSKKIDKYHISAMILTNWRHNEKLS